jgi:hypothetical protein
MHPLKPINVEGFRVIRTARDKASINQAANDGFFPLLKWVIPSAKICTKKAVFQHKYNGKIDVVSDFREYGRMLKDEDFVLVLDLREVYPYQFPEHFAAYLIPEDLAVGEEVFLEDLIEDYIGVQWNQGDCFRLKSAKAKWTGSDFEVLYDEERDASTLVG